MSSELPDWTLAEVDAARMKVLALLLADPNPLHYDPAVAPRLGMGDRPVNQGPSNMAMLANLVRAAYPDGRLRRLSVGLRGTVNAGDSVRASGRETARRRQGGTTTVQCEVALTVTGDGRTVLSGTAELELPDFEYAVHE